MYRCELCDRWFCEKHLELKLAFIRNLERVEHSPEIRVLYYTEMQREDGHPDFEYSRRKFNELDIAEKERSQLIDDALDGMNAYFKTKSHQKEKYIESVYEKEPNQANSYREKPSKRRPFPFRKVIGVILAVMVIGVLLWYAPAIISFVQNYSSQPSFTKLILMNSSNFTKVQFGDIDYELNYASQNNQYYLGVENSLLEMKLYHNPTNESDYKDIGIEIKVSEMHSDYIVLFVKPTVQNYLAQSGYAKLTIANGQYQTVNFSGNEYFFSYAYTLMNSYNQGMVGVSVLTITTPLLQSEQRYLSTPYDQFTSKFGLNVTAWAVPEYVTVFVKASY